jgi:signal transduction histidine kinase
MDGAGGISCQFEADGEVDLDEAVALHLYRIAQEAMNNAIRHGHASNIDLALRNTAAGGALTIRDNGVGIKVGSRNGDGGIGIQVMNYRARMIGAALQVVPNDEGGTMVSCTWPHRRLNRDYVTA